MSRPGEWMGLTVNFTLPSRYCARRGRRFCASVENVLEVVSLDMTSIWRGPTEQKQNRLSLPRVGNRVPALAMGPGTGGNANQLPVLAQVSHARKMPTDFSTID